MTLFEIFPSLVFSLYTIVFSVKLDICCHLVLFLDENCKTSRDSVGFHRQLFQFDLIFLWFCWRNKEKTTPLWSLSQQMFGIFCLTNDITINLLSKLLSHKLMNDLWFQQYFELTSLFWLSMSGVFSYILKVDWWVNWLIV